MVRQVPIHRLFVLFLLLSVFLLSVVPGVAEQRPFVVLLDPAHGGDDSGVVHDSFKEKEFTLQLARAIREEAKKIPGLQVSLTRDDDKKAVIAMRKKAASTVKADCILSLHANAGFGVKASGYEMYFPGFDAAAVGSGGSTAIIKDMDRNKSLNDSVLFSQYMQAALDTVLSRKGRGLREAPVPLLTGLAVPGLAVEIGFATTPEDRKFLMDSVKRKELAAAVARGLGEFSRKAK
jgi:N-acetylmuramoyl-L-alanine amidase